MSRLKKAITSMAVCGLVMTGSVVGAEASQAAEGVDMQIACKITNNHAYGWDAKLEYPSQGVYGWRCKRFGSTTGVNVNKYCQDIHGTTAYFLDQNNPYSWRC